MYYEDQQHVKILRIFVVVFMSPAHTYHQQHHHHQAHHLQHISFITLLLQVLVQVFGFVFHFLWSFCAILLHLFPPLSSSSSSSLLSFILTAKGQRHTHKQLHVYMDFCWLVNGFIFRSMPPSLSQTNMPFGIKAPVAMQHFSGNNKTHSIDLRATLELNCWD